MAGIDLGSLAGAAANLTTAFSKPKSPKSFMKSINDFGGIQVLNDYEVNFSGLPDVDFFITTIDVPAVNITTTDVFFKGRSIKIPVKYDYEHEFSMTVINDAKGYIYSSLLAWLTSGMLTNLTNSGYTMTLKLLQGDKTTSVITMRGVILTGISGLSFGNSANDISTFTLNGTLIDFSATPGALSQVGGVLGAAGSILG